MGASKSRDWGVVLVLECVVVITAVLNVELQAAHRAMGVADLELNADGNQHDSMAPPPTTTPHQSSSPSSLESSEDVARRAGESGRMSLLNKDENNDAGEQERKGSVGVIVGRLDLCSAHARPVLVPHSI